MAFIRERNRKWCATVKYRTPSNNLKKLSQNLRTEKNAMIWEQAQRHALKRGDLEFNVLKMNGNFLRKIKHMPQQFTLVGRFFRV